MNRVVLTGVGLVTGGVAGGRATLEAFLASGRPAARRMEPAAFAGVVDEGEARRRSRVCQLTVAAARIALADAGLDPARGLGLAIGTEFGDLTSTIAFVDGFLGRGPHGLSPLLFPNTVMNTMAATAAIAVGARELSLTLSAPTVAGDLAIVRAAAAVRSGRAAAVLAGGVDELDPLLLEVLGEMGAGGEERGEGAGLVVLESETAARGRGAHPFGEILGTAWRALPARPYCVGRRTASRAIAAALADARVPAEAIGRVYTSASGDLARDRWEAALLDAALAPNRPPREALAARVGRHAGVAALSVAVAALRGSRDGPALVHAVARGGNQVAAVVQRS